jgi:hypothetical protein
VIDVDASQGRAAGALYKKIDNFLPSRLGFDIVFQKLREACRPVINHA